MNIRVGEGWDTHALVEGRPLMLGGVHIPFEKGLLGHSDADALLHAMLSIRDLPPAQRKIWQQQFEHYVFNANDDTAAHLPADKRGILGPMLEQTARKLRAMLLSRLNR